MNKEEMIFHLKKDYPYRNSKEFKKDIKNNFKMEDLNFREVYTKIINYQIKKYGNPVFTEYYDECFQETQMHKKAQSKDRKSKRRNYESKRYYQKGK